jgi:hypothetical protein
MSQSFNERADDCKFDQEVNFLNISGEPAAGIEFEIWREDSAVIRGKSSDSGSTGVQMGSDVDAYTVRWKGKLP